MSYINLHDGGSTTILKDTDESVMLIDSGYSSNDANRIMTFLQNKYSNKIKLKIFITHPDSDHINGLLKMIEKGYNFSEIIMPIPQNSKAEKKVSDFDNKIIEYGFEKTISPETQIVKYSNKTAIPTNSDYDAFILPTANQISAFLYKMNENAIIKIYRLSNPGNMNDHSLIIRSEYNGVSHLNMGDIGMPVIRKLVEREKEEKEKYENEKNRIQHEYEKIQKESIDNLKEIEKSYESETLEKIKGILSKNSLIIKSAVEYRLRKDIENNRLDKNNLNEVKEAIEKYKTEEYKRILQELNNKIIIESINEKYKNIFKEAETDLVINMQKAYKKYKNEIAELKMHSFVISSNVLQWPHHFWLPMGFPFSGKSELTELLKAVNPQFIIITTPKKGVRQNKVSRFRNLGQNYEIIMRQTPLTFYSPESC